VNSCLLNDTVLYVKDSAGQVFEATLDLLERVLDADSNEVDIGQYRFLCRTGWTTTEAVLRRMLWEGEPLYQIRTRAGLLNLTGQQPLPVVRGLEEKVVLAKDVRAGDSLLVLEKPKLGKKAPPLGESMSFRPFGVLEVRKSSGYQGRVYQLETAEGTLVANDHLVHCRGLQWERPR
jgi:hypothetical protein